MKNANKYLCHITCDDTGPIFEFPGDPWLFLGGNPFWVMFYNQRTKEIVVYAIESRSPTTIYLPFKKVAELVKLLKSTKPPRARRFFPGEMGIKWVKNMSQDDPEIKIIQRKLSGGERKLKGTLTYPNWVFTDSR